MATKEETQGPKAVLWPLPQEAGLGEESAPEEGLTPGEPRPASPFVPVCLSLLQTANFPAQFPFPAETRRAEPPFTGASKNQLTVETVLITVVCPCCGCLGMRLSHRPKMLLVTGSFWSHPGRGVWKLQIQIFSTFISFL